MWLFAVGIFYAQHAVVFLVRLRGAKRQWDKFRVMNEHDALRLEEAVPATKRMSFKELLCGASLEEERLEFHVLRTFFINKSGAKERIDRDVHDMPYGFDFSKYV